MNTILQKRIEEAAKFIAVKNAPLIGTRLYDECCYNSAMEMATFALQNQWISVEEALPEDTELYFVAYKAMDRVLYSTGCYEAKFKEWYVDGYGYNADVTHWMPKPSLEGGEKRSISNCS